MLIIYKKECQLLLSKSALSLGFCILASLLFLVFPSQSVSLVSGFIDTSISKFDLVFLVITSLILILSLVIAITPYGKIRLGDDKPEFSRFTWLAMLFAAGMGSGLIFWGVAEPVFHLNAPTNLDNSKSYALAITNFHWGLHAWAIYAISGLSIAWFAYKKGRGMSISASFTKHPSGYFYIFDLFAVIAIIFGVAGTLANTISLIETGLQQSTSLNFSGINFRITMLVLITLAFVASSLTGLKKGIKYLSNFNILLAIFVLCFVMIAVNPINVFSYFVESTFEYIKALPKLSFVIESGNEKWSQGWTVIYLIWWIAWAPFVGLFIARISKGRSIREFILSVVLFPTIASILWFSTFGGGAFSLDNFALIQEGVNESYTNGLFLYFDQLPLSQLLSIASIVLLITFVITSADSAVYVTGLLTADDRNIAKLIWSLVLFAITLSLLYQNNVDLNKIVAIGGAVPFTFILVAQIIMLIKSLVSHKKSTVK